MYAEKIKNEKGSVMLAVIIILAILVILGVTLLDSASMGFGISKHEETAEMAYSAAQSGIEKCFSFIDKYCSDGNYVNDIVYSGEEDFAQKVIKDKIKPELRSYTSLKYGTDPNEIIYKIGLSGSTSDAAQVLIKDVQYLGWEEGDPGKIIVTIGITAAADFSRASDKANNKEIFARHKFTMTIPQGFQLNAAIYSIGDLMVENISANIKGDVVVFGTSPKYSKQIEQFFYGGIYAKNNGHLSINGNAYSRGLIRTGEYHDFRPPSNIYVYKDAIANGVQVFGTGDKIVVGRNAYTFDDLEMNGEDSVIAINGSYVGLSNAKDALAHDQSSAIVSSAIVHNSSSDESMKSRIVINGDVIVNGGTFKVEDDGSTSAVLPQIEDASVAADKSNEFGTPKYKEYLDQITDHTIPDNVPSDYYHTDWLPDIHNRGRTTGFANLLQCWTPGILNNDTAINEWLTAIDNARGIGFNSGIDIPSSVSGFCHYEFAANDRLYFMSPKDSAEIEIEPLKFINSGFTIDNIEEPAIGWERFWKDGLPGRTDWKNLADYTVINAITAKINEIKGWLEPMTQVFASRKNEYGGQEESLVINTLVPAKINSESGNKFLSLRDQLLNLKSNLDPDPVRYVLDFTGTVPGSVININEEITMSGVENPEDMYFLVISPDPSVELVIDGSVNGIIFSMGRVMLKNGAHVRGSILAAGKGYTDDHTKNYVLSDKSSADQEMDETGNVIRNYLPQILREGENLDRLNEGSYAGVYFIDAIPGSGATVEFPGRDALLDAFYFQGIDLKSIF